MSWDDDISDYTDEEEVSTCSKPNQVDERPNEDLKSNQVSTDDQKSHNSPRRPQSLSPNARTPTRRKQFKKGGKKRTKNQRPRHFRNNHHYQQNRHIQNSTNQRIDMMHYYVRQYQHNTINFLNHVLNNMSVYIVNESNNLFQGLVQMEQQQQQFH